LNIDSRFRGLHLHLRRLLLRHLNLRRRLVDLDLGLDHGNIDIRTRHLNDNFGLWNVDRHRGGGLLDGYLWLGLSYCDLRLWLLHCNLRRSLFDSDGRRGLLNDNVSCSLLRVLCSRWINPDQSVMTGLSIVAGLVGSNLLDRYSGICRLPSF